MAAQPSPAAEHLRQSNRLAALYARTPHGTENIRYDVFGETAPKRILFGNVLQPDTNPDFKGPDGMAFGTDGRLGVVRDGFASLAVKEIADLPNGEADLVVHDAHTEDPAYAFALSRLTDGGVLHRAPVGVFRSVEHPAYDDMVRQQISTAQEAQGPGDLQALVTGSDTWTVN